MTDDDEQFFIDLADDIEARGMAHDFAGPRRICTRCNLMAIDVTDHATECPNI